jgi:hypothetical protein
VQSSEYRADGKPVVLLIGRGGMPVQCAEMLIAAGFDIAGLHSPDAPLRDWAEHRGMPFVPDFANFEIWGCTIAYDYLFSVVNMRILSPRLINSPRGLAINYHDGPLPRYAGSNATAWALENGETSHGITWHVIEQKVDTGDILKQVLFPVAQNETKESLDQKCYLAAMRAFRVLLAELKEGTYTRTPQDLGQRTFYKRSDVPTALPVATASQAPAPHHQTIDSQAGTSGPFVAARP